MERAPGQTFMRMVDYSHKPTPNAVAAVSAPAGRLTCVCSVAVEIRSERPMVGEAAAGLIWLSSLVTTHAPRTSAILDATAGGRAICHYRAADRS